MDRNNKSKNKKGQPPKQNIKLERGPGSVQTNFLKMGGQKTISGAKINKVNLIEFLKERYKPKYASRIANVLTSMPTFNITATTPLSFEDYCTGIENIFGQDDEGLKKLAFKLLDFNNDRKVSERDLNMIVGGIKNDPEKENSKLIKIRQEEGDVTEQPDIFVEVFFNDYLKIFEKIDKKKAKDLNIESNFKKIDTSKKKQNPNASDNEDGENIQDIEFKFDKKSVTDRDVSQYLDEKEFVKINFDIGYPMIIKDLFKHLIGQDLLRESRIKEEDEF